MTALIQQSLHPVLRSVQRRWLDLWGSIGIAPGWRYAAFERFGEGLIKGYLRRAILPNRCTLWCDLRDHVQRQIYFQGVYEPLETHLFCQLVQPGMTVIDAGANIGQYSMLASTKVGEAGSVHSFEPVPTTFAQLSKNVRNNELLNVNVNQVGLWQNSKPIRLSLAQDMAQNCGAYSIGAENRATAIDAIAVSLDEYAQQQNIERIDLIKMDIEGAEYAALLGMQHIIQRDHPIFLMEINPAALERLGYDAEALWHLMVKVLGYDAYQIGLTSCSPVQSIVGIPQSNLLFVHPSSSVKVTQATWNFKQILRWSRQCKSLL